MRGYQVSIREIGVASGHLQRRVPQHPLKVEDPAARADVMKRERVPEGMERPARRGETEAYAQTLDLSQRGMARVWERYIRRT